MCDKEMLLCRDLCGLWNVVPGGKRGGCPGCRGRGSAGAGISEISGLSLSFSAGKELHSSPRYGLTLILDTCSGNSQTLNAPTAAQLLQLQKLLLRASFPFGADPWCLQPQVSEALPSSPQVRKVSTGAEMNKSKETEQ